MGPASDDESEGFEQPTAPPKLPEDTQSASGSEFGGESTLGDASIPDTATDGHPALDASAALPEDLDLASSSESGEYHQFGAYPKVPDDIQSASGSEFSGESTSDDESESDETSSFVHGDLDLDDDAVSGDESPIPDVGENLRVNVNEDDQDARGHIELAHGIDEDLQATVGDDHPVQDTDEIAHNDERSRG